MTKHGELTAEIAKSLKFQGYDVFYDHGDSADPNVGTIVSSMEKVPAMGEEFSQLDIAIIERATKRALALIEIEETTDTPKTFLGDIFGFLMGRSISFRGNSGSWKIGNWTTLVILGKGKNHEGRNELIHDMALKAKSVLGTENSMIGDIVIKDSADKASLKEKLREQIEICIKSALPI